MRGPRVNLLLALVAGAAAAGSRFLMGQATDLPGADAIRSSRNGGRRGGNRAVQRAATKARNVKRHRAQCRRAHA